VVLIGFNPGNMQRNLGAGHGSTNAKKFSNTSGWRERLHGKKRLPPPPYVYAARALKKKRGGDQFLLSLPLEKISSPWLLYIYIPSNTTKGEESFQNPSRRGAGKKGNVRWKGGGTR